MEKQYLCIDLKSFFASVECAERGLDPMTTDLVVADPERGSGTICLAVSPSLKAKGVKNRCRVFEIPKHLKYIMAEPRMQKYIDYAAEIYAIYLDYISPDDIHVYSIDEVFIDATPYLTLYRTTAKEFAVMLMGEIHKRLKIHAACGIGTNLYLAKIALDITAKHAADFIGILDERSYIETLWEHRPLTDFWRIGEGIASRLGRYGIYTMGGIARMPEDYIYGWFGIDAELMIDHAWGREPTTIADIKSYRSKTKCLTSGQVLMRDYTFDEGRLVVKEMMDSLCLDMTRDGYVTKSVTLQVGYSNKLDLAPAKGSAATDTETNAAALLIPAISALYDRIVDPRCMIKRINITCQNLADETAARQLSMFEDTRTTERAKSIQTAMLTIKGRYGKNAIFRGMDLEGAATALQRNGQIGGHKSGAKT